MNEEHAEYLKRDFAIHHFPDSKENLYETIKDKSEHNYQRYLNKKSKKAPHNPNDKFTDDSNTVDGIGRYGAFWTNLSNGKVVFSTEHFKKGNHQMLLRQSEESNGIESIAVIGKAFDSLSVHTSSGIIKYPFDISYIRNVSVAWIDIDFTKNIEKLEITFKHDIMDPLTIPVKQVTKQEILEQKEREQKENDKIVPEIKHKHSTGDSLVNVKFDYIYLYPKVKVKVKLYDDEKDLMGIFEPEPNMKFVSIINLAYGKYFYKVVQYDKEDNELQDTDYVQFNISKPNYSGKPLR